MASTLTLDIITQEKRLLTETVKQVTVETSSGEITLLPSHVPLLTKLTEGLLRYIDHVGSEKVVAVFGGFLELDSQGLCSVLADSAVRADDIDQAKVERAKADAELVLQDKEKEKEYALAEAALRRAALELKAADRKTRHSQN